MKYLLILFMASICFSATAQNGKDENQIKKNASLFLKAIANEQYDDAKKLGAMETISMIDQMIMLSEMTPDVEKPQMQAAREIAKKATFSIGNVSFHNDELAMLTYTSSTQPYKNEIIFFSKIDEKWMVDFAASFDDQTIDKDEVTDPAMDIMPENQE